MIFTLAFSGLWVASAKAEPKLMQAPVLPQTAGLPGRGHVDPPFDTSYIRPFSDFITPLVLPARFDGRDTGMVTPVRNQGGCGSCWAFAATADLESDVLLGEGVSSDLAEQALVSCAISAGGCSGGNTMDAINYYSLDGSVPESSFPYTATDAPCLPPYPRSQFVTEWRMLTGSTLPTDITPLKNAILNHGPIVTGIHAGGSFGAYTTGVFYEPGEYSPDHEILIIGWDDDMAHPGGTGAWIVKNSWGPAWGQSGYGYVAYGSAAIGKNSSCIAAYQPHNPDRELIAYDEYGWRTAWGYGTTTACAAVRFTPGTNGILRAIEFWSVDRLTSYTIDVYDDFNGSSFSALLGSRSGSCPEAGYYSIYFADPIPVTSGDEIIIKMGLTCATSTFPVAADYTPPLTSGKCYMSYNGANHTWGALTNDICIRSRIEPDYRLTMAVSPSGAGTTDPPAGTYQYGWSTVVPISASPAAGYVFDHWDGGAVNPTSASTGVKIDAGKTVTAVFIRAYSLTISADPSSGGTTDPAPGTHIYASPTMVTVTALPHLGSALSNWVGDAADPTAATTTVNVNAAKTVTAVFGPDIPSARQAADQTELRITRGIVTAVFGDAFYVEMGNRSGGIKIRKIGGHTLDKGQLANIAGHAATSTDGEKFVEASSVSSTETGTVPRPLGTALRDIGGGNWFYDSTTKAGQIGMLNRRGLSNIGVLVKCWGVSAGRDAVARTFWISDPMDTYPFPAEAPAVKVVCPSAVTPPSDGLFLRVTGIVSCYGGTSAKPQILLRDSGDLQPL